MFSSKLQFGSFGKYPVFDIICSNIIYCIQYIFQYLCGANKAIRVK